MERAIFPGEWQKRQFGDMARPMDMERGSQPLLLNDEAGLLAVLPEVRRLGQFQERNDWHSDDPLQQSARIYQWLKGLSASLQKTTEALELPLDSLLPAKADPGRVRHTVAELLAFAALIHDVGKAAQVRSGNRESLI